MQLTAPGLDSYFIVRPWPFLYVRVTARTEQIVLIAALGHRHGKEATVISDNRPTWHLEPLFMPLLPHQAPVARA